MLSLEIAAAIDRQMAPRGFSRAAFVEYGQLRLIVYNHSSVNVDHVKSAKHGIGNFFNKGGVAAKIIFSRKKAKDDKSSSSSGGNVLVSRESVSQRATFDAAFLGVHLPAHEGQKDSRNAALTEITNDEHVADVMDNVDATILMGPSGVSRIPYHRTMVFSSRDTALRLVARASGMVVEWRVGSSGGAWHFVCGGAR